MCPTAVSDAYHIRITTVSLCGQFGEVTGRFVEIYSSSDAEHANELSGRVDALFPQNRTCEHDGREKSRNMELKL
jgi:hypothetical protein